MCNNRGARRSEGGPGAERLDGARVLHAGAGAHDHRRLSRVLPQHLHGASLGQWELRTSAAGTVLHYTAQCDVLLDVLTPTRMICRAAFGCRTCCGGCTQLEHKTTRHVQVLAVPLLAGSSFGDSRGIPLVTWLSALGAIVGVSLLEQSGAAPGIGDVWSLLSAIFFGVQVWVHSPAFGQSAHWQGWDSITWQRKQAQNPPVYRSSNRGGSFVLATSYCDLKLWCGPKHQR